MSVIGKRNGSAGDREGNAKKQKSDSLQHQLQPLKTYPYNPDWEVDHYYDVALKRQDQFPLEGLPFTVEGAYDDIFASSLDGDRLAMSWDDCIWLFSDVGDLKNVCTNLSELDSRDRYFPQHWLSVSCLAFSPNGEMLASGYGNGTLKIWNTSPEHEKANPKNKKFGERLLQFWPTYHTETVRIAVTSVAWSSDGTKVAIGTRYESRREAENFIDGSIFVWHVDHDQEMSALGLDTVKSTFLCKIEDFAGGPSLSFSPDGMKIVSGYSNDVKVWDLNKRSDGSIACLQKFNHPEHVSSVLFSPDGKMIASGCTDGTVKVYNIDKQSPPLTLGQKYPKSRPPYPHDGEDDSDDEDTIFYLTIGVKVSVMFSLDGRILALKNKKKITLWDVHSGLHLKTFKEEAEKYPRNSYRQYRGAISRAVSMSFFERDNETYFRYAFLKNRLKEGRKTPEAKVRFYECKRQWWLKEATMMLTALAENIMYTINDVTFITIQNVYSKFFDGTYYYILNIETNNVEKYTEKGLMAWIKKKRRRAMYKRFGDSKYDDSSAKALGDFILQLRF